MGFFDKLKAGLQKTKDVLLAPIDNLFTSYEKVDDEFFEELCDLLIMADVGAGSSQEIVDRLKLVLKKKKIKETSVARSEFIEILKETVGNGEPLKLGNGLSVILVIGVNGVGKTTSIGKISANLKKDGKKVMLAAADTFRAAAIEQLEVWANRSDVPLIKQGEGADPAAVVFDALSAAKKQEIDVLIVDTAGRLHNKKNLLDELAKINRVIDKELPNATRETLLVLDASTGQNALIQAKEFGKAASISGIVITKLDGTAKGGIMLSIKRELGIPVKYIGVGESVEDLQPFDAEEFVQAFFDKKSGVK